MQWLGLALALAIVLFVVGGPSWLAAPAVAAAMCGRFSDTPFPAIIGAGTLGGELAAGAVDGQSFLLRVVVPLSPQA